MKLPRPEANEVVFPLLSQSGPAHLSNPLGGGFTLSLLSAEHQLEQL